MEFIILFGSYARGDWVSDRYKEAGVTYEYESDFDLLVIVKNSQLEQNFGLWNSIEQAIDADEDIITSVNLVVDTIHFVNARILEGNYFYTDIRREGLVLFDSGNVKLSEPGELDENQQRVLAKQNYAFWVGKAQTFLKDYQHNMEDGEHSNAAFHLHQAVEALYTALLLVATGYKPKTHNLAKIEHLLIQEVPEVAQVFPKKEEDQRKLFELLRKAYIDARYKLDYSITSQDLESLRERVSVLEQIVTEFCKERLNS